MTATRKILALLDPISYLVVPLMTGGVRVGVLVLVTTPISGRRFGKGDVGFVEDLGARCVLTIENSRLYREAREALRERDEFISVASHELRTPITTIRAIAQLLIQGLPSEDSRMAHLLEQQTDRLNRLVGQLLDMTRIESGKLRVDVKQVDVPEFLSDIVEATRARVKTHRFVYSPAPRFNAEIDPVRIEQVVVNLLDNAVRYSPKSSRIKIEARSFFGEEFEIRITDEGRGIPLAQREKIFDRYYRATESYSASGLGLGLYIAKQIIELHGGKIWVENASPHGVGTCFVMRVPQIRAVIKMEAG